MWGSDPRQYRCGAGQTGRQPSPPTPDSSVLCWGAERCQAGKSIIPPSGSLLSPPVQQRVVLSLLFQRRDPVGGWQAGRASL